MIKTNIPVMPGAEMEEPGIEEKTVNRKIKKSSLAKRNWSKLKRNRLAMVGLAIVLVLAISSIAAPLITPYRQDGVDLRNRAKSPSLEHPLGTDKIGRDVFARMLYGGRVSILVALSGALGGGLLGIIIGSICGYLGGTVDKVFLRISEIFMSFPQLILVLILVVFLGQGVWNLVLIFWVTGWMGPYRLVRGRFMSLREEYYVEACRVFGIGNMSIMFKHILPNTLGPITVHITLSTAGFILQESALSFLGLGVPSGIATWGNIINAAKSIDVIMNNWWLWVPPGLAISLFVLGVNFLGDGLRDVMDPTQ